jgi:hypothetical protein
MQTIQNINSAIGITPSMLCDRKLKTVQLQSQHGASGEKIT